MISRYLLSSVVRVLRPAPSLTDGVLTSTWQPVAGLESVRCRLEVNFYRPNKDVPQPPQAGRAPDRVAVYWVAPGTDLRPGDHLECLSGPVDGTWEVQTKPDRATGMSSLHHLEGQALEIATAIAGSGGA